MTGLGEKLGYYLTHPEAIIYGVATALLYPVLFLEVFALLVAAYEAGRFCVEVFKRRRARKKLDVEAAAVAVAQATGTDKRTAALGFLGSMGPSPIARTVASSLEHQSTVTRSHVLKALADADLESVRVLERTRMLMRVGPILGLMGTLIPISPALVALASGDVQQLSDNLVIAFSTTVVGLLIGSIGYIVTAVRDRHHQQDLTDIEYVFDHLGG
ncbi:MAG: MotA/TolQ/ExbB proton channel family protein [Coriobacteriia bacterium]|nr:MotA/TolQ/ExbB proton channel family protein [Coriobacteriia bacterium]